MRRWPTRSALDSGFDTNLFPPSRKLPGLAVLEIAVIFRGLYCSAAKRNDCQSRPHSHRFGQRTPQTARAQCRGRRDCYSTCIRPTPRRALLSATQPTLGHHARDFESGSRPEKFGQLFRSIGLIAPGGLHRRALAALATSGTPCGLAEVKWSAGADRPRCLAHL